MAITTKRSGTPAKFDGQKAGKLIAGYVPGAILRRTDQGIDATGASFAPYKPGYRRTLAKMGEDQKTDLRLTGGLMASIKARDIEVTADGVRVTIAPDTGTSPEVRAPSETRALRRAGLVEGRFGETAVNKILRRGEARRLGRELEFEGRGARMIRTGERGPPHNVLGYWLHHGTPTMQARPFMGLTPEQERELLALLTRARVFG